MLKLTIGCLAVLLAACGSGPSQTGAISQCGGITLSGPGAFKPLSGMAYQVAADLGGGESAAGAYEVVIWSGSGDAGTPTQSYQLICPELLGGAFASTDVFIPPQTLEWDLPSPLAGGSYQTAIMDFTRPYSESTSALEDLVGNVNITNIGSACLSGNFSANLVPVDPTSGFAIDGGTVTPISGSFDVPYCNSN